MVKLNDTNYDDTPELRLEYTTGRKSRKATMRVYKYPDGEVNIQIEDEECGGEMWFDNATQLGELVHELLVVKLAIEDEELVGE